MASRHDIVSITFQANAGKANVALQTLQTEAQKSRDKVVDLKKQLDEGLRANLPADQISKIRDDIKQAEKEVKQWDSAYKELTKGVRTLDEAVKQFNAGTLGQMSAAFNKAAMNAAKLAQTKMVPGSQEWKEMDALIVETQSNVLKATTDINGLVNSIKKGGSSNKSTLTQAKTDLEQLLTLEVRGSAEWKTYDAQLKVVTGELNKLAEAERKAVQADQTAAMSKRMRHLKTESSSGLSEIKRYWETMIAGAEKGSAELAKYEANLKKVVAQERSRTAESAKQVLTNPNKFGIDQARNAVQEMTRLRDSLQAGIPLWHTYNNLVKQGEAYLTEYAEREKIAKGEAMSLADALKLSANAGGKGFSGTATQLQQAEAALQKAASTAKKGSPEWIKYQEALAKVRVEMQNAGMTSERMQAILEKPANAKNLNELQAAVKRAKAELDLMAGTVGKNSTEYAKLASKTKEAEIRLKELQAQAKGTASAFDKAWSRLKTYIGLYVGAAVAMQKITATMGDVLELSDKMGEVRKTTGFTADEVGRLSGELKKLDTRTTLTGLLDLSVAAGQLGLKTQEDVEGFTIAANKLMVALPEMGKEGATQMLKVALATGEIDKIRRQMEQGLIEGSSATAVAMEKVGSTIDRLRATSAATAPAITDFVKRVGAVGAQSGITIDQVAALGSTVDALGMRVEMSATALSRMIPAIKNNAFAIGQVIGKTEEYIKKSFEQGRGMDVILDIFDAIKRSGKQSADDIESMFGGSMKEIMKELNQQGARAGIVFAGLSQNVDELRRQLGVAAKAYEENIAIQQEYNKMNETTAAKWERLKNEFGEMFVGDNAQRFFGVVIDGLRNIVNLISGNVKPSLQWLSTTIKTLITMWAVFKLGLGEGLFYKLAASIKSMGQSIALMAMYTKDYLVYQWQLIRAKDEEARATIRAQMAQKGLNKEMMANVWMAVAAAIVYVVYKLYDYIKASKEAAAEAGRFSQKVYEEQQALNNLFEPLNKANLAQEERSKLISEINSKYGKYLGYMLSETSSAVQLADAHALIAKRIREEAYERRIAEQEKKVQEAHDEDVNAAYAKMTDRMRSGARGSADAQAMADMMKGIVDGMMGQIKYAYDDSDNIFKARTNYFLDPKVKAAIDNGIERLILDGKLSRDNVSLIQKAVYKYTVEAKSQHDDIMKTTANVRSDLRNIQGAIQNDLTRTLNGLVGNIINFAKQQSKPAPQTPGPLAPQPQPQKSSALTPFWQQGGQQQSTGWGAGWGTGGQQQQQTIQKAPADWKPQIDEKDVEQVRQFVKNQDDLRGAIKANAEGMSSDMKEIYESYLVSDKEMDRLRKLVADEDKKNNPSGGGNPYGGFTVMDSYDKWSADALVDRKKQMLQYVRAMANGADVQSILSQDKKFMDDATRKGIKDVRQAIEWYNTERLKIQEELADRHLTNEGQWANPSKAKGRKSRTPMSNAAIAELERYYAWRKEVIEEKRAEEGMSETEFNRRMDALEQEHLQKRSDLRKSFTSKDQQFVEQFRKWWAGVRELEAQEWELTEAEWKVATERDIKYNNMNAQKDLASMRAIVVKQLKAIEDIIAKERPFNGITENLQSNLETMGILLADYDKKRKEALEKNAGKEELDKIDADANADTAKRLVFLLEQSEDAYMLTIEELMKRMGDAGMQSLVDALNDNENGDKMKRALLAQLRKAYDDVQNAIKKESSQIRKEVDTWWNDIKPGQEDSRKGGFEKAISALGIEEERVKRINSLIGAGYSSERVADRLAIKQMQIRLTMQETYYNKLRLTGSLRVKQMKQEAEEARKLGDLEEAKRKELDAQHLQMSLNLSLAKEQSEVLKTQEELTARIEENENRLYKQMQEYSELIYSSVQSLFEASNAGNENYYNERAKLNLTGKGGPGAGTYVVIDNAGTSDAKAHYEYLDERQALEREHEIEQQNAQAEAWKKVMDDMSAKLNEQITDWMNSAALDANTQAVMANTQAILASMGVSSGESTSEFPVVDSNNPETWGYAARKRGGMDATRTGGTDEISTPSIGETPVAETPAMTFPMTSEQLETVKGYQEEAWQNHVDVGIEKLTEMSEAVAEMPSVVTNPTPMTDDDLEMRSEKANALADIEIAASDRKTDKITSNQMKIQKTEKDTENQMVKGSQTTFAKMTAAANLYGIAYQAMSNDNLSTSQKFQTIALQAAGQSAIAMMQADLFKSESGTLVNLPKILSECLSISPIAGAAIFAVLSALLGAALGVAASNMAKKKSEVAKVTGASASAGRLATGMMTYAKGNVNELTDPDSLTPGRHYNVDGADGKTYRAKYMGKNAKTHITTGPEFHLVGEKGQEAIIDAHTTRNIRLNEPEIWQNIQTLYNGGRLSPVRRRRGRGVPAFADGNLDDFEEITDGMETGSGSGIGADQVMQLQASLDRNSDVLERAMNEGIKGVFDVYNKGGLVDTYDTAKKNLTRHGERY